MSSGGSVSFWNNADYAFQHNGQDSINEGIWAQSAGIHNGGIFTPASLADAGCYGAQQAMLDPAVLGQTAAGIILPWVPDVLGANWEDERAVHVVGWAYAGFITEISTIYHPSAAEGQFRYDPGYKDSIQYLDKVTALISSGRYC
jgi:hypothetical protein